MFNFVKSLFNKSNSNKDNDNILVVVGDTKIIKVKQEDLSYNELINRLGDIKQAMYDVSEGVEGAKIENLILLANEYNFTYGEIKHRDARIQNVKDTIEKCCPPDSVDVMIAYGYTNDYKYDEGPVIEYLNNRFQEMVY